MRTNIKRSQPRIDADGEFLLCAQGQGFETGSGGALIGLRKEDIVYPPGPSCEQRIVHVHRRASFTDDGRHRYPEDVDKCLELRSIGPTSVKIPRHDYRLRQRDVLLFDESGHFTRLCTSHLRCLGSTPGLHMRAEDMITLRAPA